MSRATSGRPEKANVPQPCQTAGRPIASRLETIDSKR